MSEDGRRWTYTEVVDEAESPLTFAAMRKLEGFMAEAKALLDSDDPERVQQGTIEQGRLFGWRSTLELADVVGQLEKRVRALEDR